MLDLLIHKTSEASINELYDLIKHHDREYCLIAFLGNLYALNAIFFHKIQFIILLKKIIFFLENILSQKFHVFHGILNNILNECCVFSL